MLTTSVESLYTRTSLIERNVDLLAELLGEDKVDYSDSSAVDNLRKKTFDDDSNVVDR